MVYSYQRIQPPTLNDKEKEEVDYTEGGIREKKFKKTFKIAVLAVLLIYLFFHYFIYWDSGENCFIRIKPAFLEFSNLGMKRALLALKHASPQDYKTVCKNVSTIEPSIGCGGFGGGCYYSEDKVESNSQGSEIVVSTSKDDLVTTAAVILHETCHAIQNKEGRPLNETECYKMDDRLLREMVIF